MCAAKLVGYGNHYLVNVRLVEHAYLTNSYRRFSLTCSNVFRALARNGGKLHERASTSKSGFLCTQHAVPLEVKPF